MCKHSNRSRKLFFDAYPPRTPFPRFTKRSDVLTRQFSHTVDPLQPGVGVTPDTGPAGLQANQGDLQCTLLTVKGTRALEYVEGVRPSARARMCAVRRGSPKKGDAG